MTLALASRAIRKLSIPDGIRKVYLRNSAEKGKDGNIIPRSWRSPLSQIGGILANFVKSIPWTLSALVGAINTTASFIMNFNWNITDAEISQSINSAIESGAGILGQAVGKTLGFIVCGAVPTLSLFVMNPTMAKVVAPRITEELLTELVEEYASAIRQLGGLALRAAGLWVYGAVRRAFRGTDEELKARLKAAGVNDKEIEKQIEARNKPFIFAGKVEETIEAIPNQAAENFVEEAWEEFGDSCVEAGYIVAGAIDAYTYQNKVAQEQGTVEIEFKPDGTYEVKPITNRPLI